MGGGGQGSIVFWGKRRQVFCLGSSKLWWGPATIEFSIFLLGLHICFLLASVCRGCSGFFLSCLDLEWFAKIKKELVSTHSFFTFVLITQDLSGIGGCPEPPFVDIAGWEACAGFHQGVLSFAVGGARRGFWFFAQMAWFLGNSGVLPEFGYGVLHNWISVVRL